MTTSERKIVFFTMFVILVATEVIMLVGLMRCALGQVDPNFKFYVGGLVANTFATVAAIWKGLLKETRENVDVGHIETRPDKSNPDVEKKQAGREFLVQARQPRLGRAKRKRLAAQALAILKSIPRDSPEYWNAQYLCTTALREMGEFGAAEELLNKLIVDARERFEKPTRAANKDEIRVELADAIMMKGVLYSRMRKYKEAYQLVEESWHLDPDNYTRTQNCYELARACGEKELAAGWYALMCRRAEHSALTGQVVAA